MRPFQRLSLAAMNVPALHAPRAPGRLQARVVPIVPPANTCVRPLLDSVQQSSAGQRQLSMAVAGRYRELAEHVLSSDAATEIYEMEQTRHDMCSSASGDPPVALWHQGVRRSVASRSGDGRHWDNTITDNEPVHHFLQGAPQYGPMELEDLVTQTMEDLGLGDNIFLGGAHPCFASHVSFGAQKSIMDVRLGGAGARTPVMWAYPVPCSTVLVVASGRARVWVGGTTLESCCEISEQSTSLLIYALVSAEMGSVARELPGQVYRVEAGAAVLVPAWAPYMVATEASPTVIFQVPYCGADDFVEVMEATVLTSRYVTHEIVVANRLEPSQQGPMVVEEILGLQKLYRCWRLAPGALGWIERGVEGALSRYNRWMQRLSGGAGGAGKLQRVLELTALPTTAGTSSGLDALGLARQEVQRLTCLLGVLSAMSAYVVDGLREEQVKAVIDRIIGTIW